MFISDTTRAFYNKLKQSSNRTIVTTDGVRVLWYIDDRRRRDQFLATSLCCRMCRLRVCRCIGHIDAFSLISWNARMVSASNPPANCTDQ
jgi:hypothetical protein